MNKTLAVINFIFAGLNLLWAILVFVGKVEVSMTTAGLNYILITIFFIYAGFDRLKEE